MDCLYCKYSNEVVEDNHDKLHCICVCAESEHFLTEINVAFDSCDCGEEESEEE